MTATCLTAVLNVVHTIPINHWAGGTQGGARLAPWQVINLVGTPLLAMLFLPPVIEDLQAWLRWRRERPR